MKTTPKVLAIASVLAAAGFATGAAAQTTYGQAYQTYQQQQSAYQAQQTAYNAARAKYDADRASYDARYGYGAYERRYGVFAYTPSTVYGSGYGTTYPYGSTYPTTSYPYGSTYPTTSYPYGSSYPTTSYPYGSTYPATTYPNTYGSGYGTPAPYGTTSPYGYNPYNAGAYGVNTAYGTNPCVSANTSGGVNSSILGALVQAALGGRSLSSSVNSAVLGSVVNGQVGQQTTSNVRCDSRGPYYTRSQTVTYREGYYDGYGRWVSTPTPRQYSNCRLAPAPANTYGSEYRYVRVCPDSSGRYRITA
jgi:hypothetical protein